MSTMTLRGIDEQIAAALKERAQKENTSVNTVMLKMIKEALGLEKKKRNMLYDDLDHLAGTWSERDAAEFENAVAVFGTIDEDIWK